MAEYVMVRDLRVHAGIPNRPNLGIINTDAHTSLGLVFHRINALARWGKIKALYILAHGKAGFDAKPRTDDVHSYSAPGAVCMDAGGMGISLGAEGIRHANVNAWRAIRGKIDNIVVYSCGAADTQPGNEFSPADGRYLMGALAINTDAMVFAGTGIQHMARFGNLPHGRFILMGWRGALLRFSPGTGAAVHVPEHRLNFDFNEIMTR
jgi:hypothetical protein